VRLTDPSDEWALADVSALLDIVQRALRFAIQVCMLVCGVCDLTHVCTFVVGDRTL
jgi:hypothetical protein